MPDTVWQLSNKRSLMQNGDNSTILSLITAFENVSVSKIASSEFRKYCSKRPDKDNPTSGCNFASLLQNDNSAEILNLAPQPAVSKIASKGVLKSVVLAVGEHAKIVLLHRIKLFIKTSKLTG